MTNQSKLKFIEFLSETIRQRILERIDEIGTEKSKLTVKAVGQTKAVRKIDQPLLYQYQSQY